MEDFSGDKIHFYLGAVTPNLFCAPKFCCARKNLFQTNDKNKNPSPIKMYFAAQTSKTGYGPGVLFVCN